VDIKTFLEQDERKDLLRFLTAGSVDDGKSTLIGRLLHDSKMIYEDQLSSLERDSKRIGHAGEEIDYALLLDGLKAEREQGITIDVAYRYFATNKRKFIIADTPGHEQYTRNMATGGSTANLAIILADASQGLLTQTRRHTFIASLLGIKHFVLAVNKMDLVDFQQDVFEKIVADYKQFITRLNIPDVQFIPLSALKGDNVVEKSERMPWYEGPSLLKYLEDIPITSDRNFVDMRFPVQYVNRPRHDFRGFAGTLASGIIRVGDIVMALPSRKSSTVTSIIHTDKDEDKDKDKVKVKDEVKKNTSTPTLQYSNNPIPHYSNSHPQPQPQPQYAFPPQAITITLADEIDISRGDMLVHPNNIPTIGRRFEAMLIWMDEEPLDASKQFFIKHTTNSAKAKIEKIRYFVDVNTLRKIEVKDKAEAEAEANSNPPSLHYSTTPSLQHSNPPSPQSANSLSTFTLNKIGRVVITTARPLFYDAYQKNRSTGAFILIDPISHNTTAVGMIIDRVSAEELPVRISPAKSGSASRSELTLAERIEKMEQEAKTIWITGLHGSGKLELAYRLERELFDLGKTVVVLDGQSVRSGLSRELDFTPADRAEHLRRVAETAKILNDHNIIVIAAFISPQRLIRRQIADIIGKERFFEVYTEADLDYCKQYDTKQLYAKAEKGLVKYLPGIDMSFDEPENPNITFTNTHQNLDAAAQNIIQNLHLINE
jgi:bifunctional enzyme CysN/CysC